MTKADLLQILIDKNPHLYRRDIEAVVNAIFNEISATLSKGSRVELRGFGSFSVRYRQARTGRNPLNGDSVSVEEKWVPFFKTGKDLRDRLNATRTSGEPISR